MGALLGTGLLGAVFLRRQGFAGSGIVFALLTIWGAGEAFSYFGMETTLHLFLIFAAVLAADRDRPLATGLLLGLVCLNRYDGVLAAVAVGLYLWYRRRRPPYREAFLAFGLFASWLLFAQLYFGSIFPNTLGAKTGDIGPWAYLVATFLFQKSVLWSPVKEYVGALTPNTELVLTFLLFLPALVLGPLLVRRRPALAMLPSFALLLAVGYAWIGPPPRHQWYHLPGLFGLIAFGLAAWGFAGRLAWDRLFLAPWARRVLFSLLPLGLLLFTLVELPTRTEARGLAYGRKTVQDKVKGYDAFARLLNRHGFGDTSLLTHEPGYLTYHTGQRAVDAAGLVSRGIYYHGPKDRRTGCHSLIETFDPDFAVTSSPHAHREPSMTRRFLPLAVAPPHFWLFMDRELHGRRLPTLLDAWTDVPPIEVGRRGRSMEQQRRDLVQGWTFRGTALDAVEGTGFGWSREFPVDFDELVFHLDAASDKTRFQLLVDDRLVAEIRATDGPQTRGLPVYPWRGRRARIRLFDVDPEGALQLKNLRPRTYPRAHRIDDFETRVPQPFWVETSSPLLASNEGVAHRFGVQTVQGRRAAVSFDLAGVHELRSRPFPVEADRLVMTLVDNGGHRTGVHLEIGGRRVLSWTGRTAAGLVHPLKWDLRPFRGQEAVLVIRDDDPLPEIGLAVDSIYAIGLRGADDDPSGERN